MINVQNITYHYPGSKHVVFQDFSLTLEPGRIYGLLGKNGTGKSTLLYLICGLLRQRKGCITIDGHKSLLREPAMLQDVCLVPEEYDLPAISLKEYVRINSVFYPRFSEDILNSCLTDFELPTDIHLKALSMGQKKKVYMSFALATGCRYIFMDEPNNGLDPPGARRGDAARPHRHHRPEPRVARLQRGRHHQDIRLPQHRRGTSCQGCLHRAIGQRPQRHHATPGRRGRDPDQPGAALRRGRQPETPRKLPFHQVN